MPSNNSISYGRDGNFLVFLKIISTSVLYKYQHCIVNLFIVLRLQFVKIHTDLKIYISFIY